ncbi:hypothetical protein FA15DRAFT_705141, partial [Coprinopsis marcescibilis]
KLSADYAKAADALKVWGQTEGEDLGNILTGSGTLLSYFATALAQYASHGHAIRETLKSIRSREEALDELRRRRRIVHRKADDAERKVSKMNNENKNYDTQVELLHRLRDEIRTLDSEIMTEEASLGDYKRACARSWMGLKFGALLECCEKGTIAADFGNRVIAEIPEETTQPGLPRSLYYGHAKVESLVNDATRNIGQVTSSSQPPSSAVGQFPPVPSQPPSAVAAQFPPVPSQQAAPRPVVNTLPLPPKGTSNLESPLSSTPYSGQAVDDFGVTKPPPPFESRDGGGGGGRFATFPVKRQDSYPLSSTSNLYSLPEPPSLNAKTEMGDSFSLLVAEALDSTGEKSTPNPQTEGSWRGRLGDTKLPPPSIAEPPKLPQVDVSNPWASDSPPKETPENEQLLSAHKRSTSRLSDDDDALLAYMTSMDEEVQSASSVEVPAKPKKQARFQDDDPSPSPPPTASTRAPPPPAPPYQTLGVEQPNNLRASMQSMQGEVVHDTPSEGSDTEKKIHRVPPPVFNPATEEKALDAAAVEELSRELDSTDFVPPKITLVNDDDDEVVDNASKTEDTRRAGISLDHNDSSNRTPSPLQPPSAPFARESTGPPSSHFPDDVKPHTGPPTAAQAYAQSYQSHPPPSLGGPRYPPTAAQAYAQAYQMQSHPPSAADSQDFPNPYGPPKDASSPPQLTNLPPRLQSLQAQNLPDPTMPPRFQTLRNQNPPPPAVQREIPPRFQGGNNNLQHQPSMVSMTSEDGRYAPSQQAQSFGSPGESIQTPSSYRTPGEYPSAGPSPLPGNLPSPYGRDNGGPGDSPQLASRPPLPVVSSGSGKISAAAFRRPQPHRGGTLPPEGSSPTSFGGSPAYSPMQSTHPSQQYQPPSQQYQPPPPQQYQSQAPPPQQYQSQPPPSQQYQSQPPPSQQYQQQPPPRQYQQQPQQPPSNYQQQPPPNYQQPPSTMQPGYPQQMYGQHRPVSRELPPPPPGASRPTSSVSDDYSQYDFINAYQGSDQGSPRSAEFARGQGQGPNRNSYGGVGVPGGPPGGVQGGGYPGGPPGGAGAYGTHPRPQNNNILQGYGSQLPPGAAQPTQTVSPGYASGRYATDLGGPGGLQ